MRRCSRLFAWRNFLSAVLRKAWFSTPSPVLKVASLFSPTSMPTAACLCSGSASGSSTWIETNHQSAVFVMRAPVTLPLKRTFSAIFTHPSLGIQMTMIPKFKLIVGEIKARFAALFALEAWDGWLCLSKNAVNAFPRSRNGCSEAFFVTSQVQGKLLYCLICVELLFELQCCRFLARFIVPIPFGQCPVPDKATGSSSTGKIICLFRRGIQSDFVRANYQQFPLQDTQNL